MNESVETLQRTSDLLTRIGIDYGPRLLAAALVLLAGYFVTRWVSGMAARGLDRLSLEPPVRQLLLRVLRVLVFALFLLMALQNLGIDLLPLVAGLGIAGAGVALALQGVLGNIMAGLSIIFTRPFRVGQYISIAGEEGQVEVVSLFSTTLRHADRSSVVIPNRKIAGEILHNYGEVRQLDLGVQITYESDLESAVATVQRVLAANSRVLRDPPPVVQASLLGEFGIGLAIKPWVAVENYEVAAGEINPEIVREFRERQIAIATPPLRSRR
jgi:small conductance mechanosensitive channel